MLSQTFCDTEMLALERRGYSLVVGSIHAPLTSIRHAHSQQLQATVHYAPPPPIMRLWEEKLRREKRWPEKLIRAHEEKYGDSVKAETRARNASYFAELFTREKVDHVHVHFANRAAHTALFLKLMGNIRFSITAHGQDFMADLGNDDLLREICDAAEFVAVETDYSRGLLARRCPQAADKIQRVYNGMDLRLFAQVPSPERRPGPARILSIGRLVAFKGFDYLLDACAELRNREVDFFCEIVGDGPLREALQTKIREQQLDPFVVLTGALSQEQVREKLRACDVFALASVVDPAGASDVFPTVILEAMASARPVVSTVVAGIPELVIDGETGLLLAPNDSSTLAAALETLCRDADLRFRFGAAGARRIEQHFSIETTVIPLLEQFGKKALPPTNSRRKKAFVSSLGRIAYLLDRWPDDSVPGLSTELEEMRRRKIPLVIFVCELATDRKLGEADEQLATDMEFLPDEMVIEAAWQMNRALAHELEDRRANEDHRLPAAFFLRQARFAVALHKLMTAQQISHLHATSSRALFCALTLKRMLALSVSAAIEAKPDLPETLIQNALRECVGGRFSEPAWAASLGDSFVLDRSRNKFWQTGRSPFWEQWSELLVRWNEQAPAASLP
ncbi:MAG: glycosyltransferase [Verrucomicrobiota bacterium]